MQKKDRVKMAKVFAEMLNLKTSEDMAFRIIHYNDFKILVGVLIGSIGFAPKDFWAHFFIQSLYRPFDCINLSFGAADRTKCSPKDVENIRFRQNIQSIFNKYEQINTLEGVLNTLVKNEIPYRAAEPHKWVEIAYAHVILGNPEEALKYIEKIEICYKENSTISWIKDIWMQSELIKKYLLTDDLGKALDTLRQWQNYTIEQLRLTNLE